MQKVLTTPRQAGPLLSEATEGFLRYALVELSFAAKSVEKYAECLRQIERLLGNRPVGSYTAQDVRDLKAELLRNGRSVSRQVSMLAALKRLLLYCRSQLSVVCLDPSQIIMPRRPRREVAFLTPEEVERFVSAVPLETLRGKVHPSGLRFRALVETLLGSAMRIGETLSLNRSDIDFQNREARIIGKGNKQRVVFFTQRSIDWILRYLSTRHDSHPALFVRQDGKARLSQTDVWRPFHCYAQRAGLCKRVTAHLLRHTAATQLLFNGCPISHIKEILGHERLETTCRYYLGLDRRAAKQAHERYLYYGPTSS